MVNKLWCRKISRAWFQTKSEPPSVRLFTEPRCQSHVATWYLTYRWLISCIWITIIICSLLEIGSKKPQGNNHKWPIYLTNWDLLFGATQSLLGGYLVTKRWRQQSSSDFEPCNMTYGKLEKVYWFMYTVTSTLAVGVTISYWAAVHDPKIHQIDPLNIMLHVCNSLLVITDLSVANIPLRLKYFWWCLVIIMIYLLFSVIYYSAGGLDKHGHHYIYKVLDWKKPGITILICLGGIIFLIIVHCLLCYLAKLCERLFMRRAKYITESQTSTSNDTSPKSKDVEIV